MLSIEATNVLDLTIQSNSCAESGEEGGCLEFLHRISSGPTCILELHELAGYPEMPNRTERHWNWGHRSRRLARLVRSRVSDTDRRPGLGARIRENNLASVSNWAWISTPTVNSHSCLDASSLSLRCLFWALRVLASCLSCLRRGTRSGATDWREHVTVEKRLCGRRRGQWTVRQRRTKPLLGHGRNMRTGCVRERRCGISRRSRSADPEVETSIVMELITLEFVL